MAAGVSGFCLRWMIPTGRTSSGMASGTAASVRTPTSFCTVWRGRMLTPAAMMIACLMVSTLSNSITTSTRTLRARSARSMARRIARSASKATKGSPFRSAGVDDRPPGQPVAGVADERHRLLAERQHREGPRRAAGRT